VFKSVSLPGSVGEGVQEKEMAKSLSSGKTTQIDKGTRIIKPQSILRVFNLNDEQRLLEIRKEFQALKKEVLHFKENIWVHLTNLNDMQTEKFKRVLPNKLEILSEKLFKNKVDLLYFVNTEYTPMPQSTETILNSVIKAFQKAKKKLTEKVEELLTNTLPSTKERKFTSKPKAKTQDLFPPTAPTDNEVEIKI
jgi:hypothetical protein